MEKEGKVGEFSKKPDLKKVTELKDSQLTVSDKNTSIVMGGAIVSKASAM